MARLRVFVSEELVGLVGTAATNGFHGEVLSDSCGTRELREGDRWLVFLQPERYLDDRNDLYLGPCGPSMSERDTWAGDEDLDFASVLRRARRAARRMYRECPEELEVHPEAYAD